MMDRREFIGGAAAGTAGLVAGQVGARPSGPPNIVIILADDLGYGDLGCYGSQAIATPNLDRMAGDGVRLTSFYSSGPVCSPSRAGLLTGRYPIRAGVTQVFFPARFPPLSLPIHALFRLGPGMPLRERTLAEALKPAGYASCCVGKWHLGDLAPYKPHHRGFDHFFGVLYSNDMVPLTLFRNDEVVDRAPADQRYFTRRYTEESVAWIEDHRDQPFLLYFASTFPHIPLHVSPEFEGRSKAGLYGDVVEELDWGVGEVLATIDRLGLAENTLVFFTSDNGPWYQGSNGENRGRKGQTFDGGMNVPGIARWPGVIPAGQVSDEPAMNFDLFATSLGLAGLEPPADRIIDGLDLVPMLSGQAGSPHDHLFFFNGRALEAVRQGVWKYHRRHIGYNAAMAIVAQGPFLFKLDSDPDESYDVSALYPDKVAELESLMREWERDFRSHGRLGL